MAAWRKAEGEAEKEGVLRADSLLLCLVQPRICVRRAHVGRRGASLSSLPSSVQENVARKSTTRLAQVCADNPDGSSGVHLLTGARARPDHLFHRGKHYTSSQPRHVPS